LLLRFAVTLRCYALLLRFAVTLRYYALLLRFAMASAAVAALIEQYGEEVVMEFKRVTGNKKIKSAAKKTAKDAMEDIVAKTANVLSLKDLIKILKKAHPEGCVVVQRKKSAWNEFFKNEMPSVKAAMPNASQGDRVKEIGRRWRAQQAGRAIDQFLNEPSFGLSSTNSGTTSTTTRSKKTSKRTVPSSFTSGEQIPKRQTRSSSKNV